MFTRNDLIWGIIVPAVLAAGAMMLAYFLRGKRPAGEPAPWGAAVAIAGGFAVAFIGITGPPRHLPPRVAQEWLVPLASVPIIVGLLATLLDHRRRLGRWFLAIISLLIVALTAYLLLQRNARPAIAPVALGMIVWWVLMEPLATRLRGATLPLLLAITSLSAAAVLMNAGVQTFAQYAAAIGFSLGAITLLNLWLQGASLSGGGVLALAVLLLGLLVCGHFFADLSSRDAILLALAPLAGWMGEFPKLSRRPVLRFAARTIAVLIVLSIPLVPAVKGLHQTLHEQQESTQY